MSGTQTLPMSNSCEGEAGTAGTRSLLAMCMSAAGKPCVRLVAFCVKSSSSSLSSLPDIIGRDSRASQVCIHMFAVV